MKKSFYIIVAVLTVVSLVSCSSNRNIESRTESKESTTITTSNQKNTKLEVPSGYTENYISEDNCLIYLPNNFSVFTRNMNSNNKILESYSISPNEVDLYLNSISSNSVSTSMYAISSDQTVIIYLSESENTYTKEYRSFKALDSEVLDGLAKGYAYTFGEPEYYETDLYKFMVFKYTTNTSIYGNVNMIRYKTMYDGKEWGIYAMKTSGDFSAVETEIIKTVASNISIN